ncbi:uncharacterized protein LOC129569110 [Sitodiplosis mosellana]|uniref:uncharacterized protein LOC129569110 n=1 Tax=Sitodiplosis mosellana TaxID=263140 RepID=UPI002444A80D|nr:uncharacterized protein LOC129569110 [Sitodiplosis mosellana]
MATIIDFDEDETLWIRLLRCILFIFVSIPSGSLLYKYIQYWNDDGPYQSTIGFSWFLLNVITVSILIYGEFFGLKLERRYKKLCYYVTTLALCAASDYLSGLLFTNLLPNHRKDIHSYTHIFWIVGAILYNVMNVYNHLILIYDTIRESKQDRSLQIAELRVSFYVVFIALNVGNLLLMLYNPAVKLRELITVNIILWSTILLGTSMLTLKTDDGKDMKQHELISLFRRYSVFTNLKTGLISFIIILLSYSVPVLICNDITNSTSGLQLQQKIHTYLPLMAWIYIFSFVRDACLMQQINQFWTRADQHVSAVVKRKVRRRHISRLRTIEE